MNRVHEPVHVCGPDFLFGAGIDWNETSVLDVTFRPACALRTPFLLPNFLQKGGQTWRARPKQRAGRVYLCASYPPVQWQRDWSFLGEVTGVLRLKSRLNCALRLTAAPARARLKPCMGTRDVSGRPLSRLQCPRALF